jgi:AcrR family transcriptional regulator
VSTTTEEIVRAAARWIHHGIRLDTRALAGELGMSRTTLFRRVGNREDLMGDALWMLSDRTMRNAVAHWEQAEGPVVRNAAGQLRCLAVMHEYRTSIATDPGFNQLLRDEPTVAIRVLTDPVGRVQPKVMAAHVDLLARDVADGGFVLAVGLESLSYALVRLGEAFLYSDVLAARAPDLEAASTLIAALVEAGVRDPSPQGL